MTTISCTHCEHSSRIIRASKFIKEWSQSHWYLLGTNTGPLFQKSLTQILTPLKLPCRTEEENNSDESKATLMSIKCKKKLKLKAKCTKGTQKSPENSDLMLWMECSLVLNIIKFLVCSCLLIFFCDFYIFFLWNQRLFTIKEFIVIRK